MPPAHIVKKVVLPPGLQLLVMSEGVVQPPDTAGHIVGKNHVYRVVPPRQQQEDNSAQGGQERYPMQENKSSRWVLFDGQVAHGQGHGVSREDVVTAVHMLPINGESSPRDYC